LATESHISNEQNGLFVTKVDTENDALPVYVSRDNDSGFVNAICINMDTTYSHGSRRQKVVDIAKQEEKERALRK
jgi:hypothetical protein